MKREELPELHYLTLIANVASILRRGIISHRRATKVHHESVAMQEIQERRKKVEVPGGRPLHEYVNLYICARNPMLFLIVKKRPHEQLCVLRVSTDVLDLPGVVIADRNASSDHVRWAAAPAGLSIVDRDLVFAEYWTHPNDQIEEWRHKSIKCAELLVPDRVDPGYVMGAYVSGAEGRAAVIGVAAKLAVDVNAHLFFR